MVRVGPRGRQGRWALLWSLMLVLMVAGPPWRLVAAQVPEPPPQEPPTFELPEVIVPGRRPQPLTSTPASVSVITREEIERSGARTVADLLRLLPEVFVRAYGGLGSLAVPSIRGSSPAQVLVLLDGVPLNNVALGQTDLSTISVDAVERIEVLRGPFSAIYGSGALGGAINIIMSRAARRGLLARAGGFDQRSISVTAAGSASAPWQLTVTTDATAGHRDNSDYTGTTAATRFSLSPTTEMLVHYYAADLGTPGDIASPTPNDRQAERRTLLQVESQRPDGTGPRGRLYYVSDYLTFVSPPFGSSTYSSSVLGGELQRAWELRPGRLLTAGLEAQRQRLDALSFGSPTTGEAVIGAGYLQYDAVISARTLSSVGIRLDSHSVYGTTLNPRAGIVYQLSELTRLRATVGRTFRGPTFLELFSPAPFGNPGLLPETAWAAEIGLERRAGGVTVAAVVFGTEATNLIVGGAPPQNVGLASVRGLSAEVRGAASGTTITVNLTLTQAVDRTTGDPLVRVPWFTANLALHRQVTPSSQLSLLAQYVGPRPDLDFSTFPATTVQLPGYVDLRLRYRAETETGWALTVGVDNALDWQYESVKGYPAPGRSVFITATMRF